MEHGAEGCFGEELWGLLAELTAKQRAAIPRIVEHVGEGGSLTSLLRTSKNKGPHTICAWNTYYRRPRGWHHQERFRAALERAQREYDEARLRTAVEEAAERLRRAAPSAVELAEAVVVAVLTGESARVPTPVARLLALMEGAEKEGDQIRAASALLSQALRSGLSILDRADIETAVKNTGGEAAQWAGLLEELRDMGDEEEMADVEAEVGGIQEAGIPSTRGPGGSAPQPGEGGAGGRGGEVGEEPLDGV